MLEIKLKLPREQVNFKYEGLASSFLNLPITMNGNAMGVITKIISNTDDFIEVEGYLFKAGINFFKTKDQYCPSDVQIVTGN